MKFLILTFVLVFSSLNSFASCGQDAQDIAEEAVKIFNVNARGAYCMAMGGLKEIQETDNGDGNLSYQANFYFPCGPQPKRPKVEVVLNRDCKIVKLQINGFSK